MLSDSIRQLRDRFTARGEVDQSSLLLTLKAFEIEARNMEDRLLFLTGQEHNPLNGQLISAPETATSGALA